MKNNFLEKIINWKIIGFIFLIPLFFLPFTVDFYEFNKNILLFVFTGILLILWLFKMALSGKFVFQKNPLDIPVLTFAGTFVLSTLINATNKWETLWSPNSTGTIIILTLFYFLLTNNLKKDYIDKCLKALSISAVFLVLLSIYQFIALKITSLSLVPVFMKSLAPTGSLISLTTFLVIILVINIIKIYFNWKNYKTISFFYTITTLLILSGLTIVIFQLFTNAKPILLPFSTTWAIAIDSFKNWRLFLFGVGPSSFLSAFSQFRPIDFNLTGLWAIRFVYSSDFYLHLLTTVGILGLAAFAWIIVSIIKIQTRLTANEKADNLLFFIPLIAIFAVMVFTFQNFCLLFIFYLLLAVFSINLPIKKEFSESSKIAAWSIFIPVTFIILASFYFIGRAYAADIFLKKSLLAKANGNGNLTYNYQIKAISLNPFNDSYRLNYSQTNLALAYSLVQKNNISDQDRQTITILVQQAIREAKTAVTLNKDKVTNWENLSSIYRQLINFAEGSDQWAITSLNQAIKLDPISPSLRLTLGGVYYALGNFDEAIRLFQQTIELKPNFANGYYNLAAAYREKGDLQKAKDNMDIVLGLIPASSSDYDTAFKEATDLAKKLSITKEASKSAEPQIELKAQEQEMPLIEPEALPSPIITPPIELPQESTSEGNLNPETL